MEDISREAGNYLLPRQNQDYAPRIHSLVLRKDGLASVHITQAFFQFGSEYLLLWNQRDIQLGDVAFIPTDVALVVDPGLRKHVQRFQSAPLCSFFLGYCIHENTLCQR